MLDVEQGQGQHGAVHVCMNKETQEIYACKSILVETLRTRQLVHREVAIMKHLPGHDPMTLVSLKKVSQDDKVSASLHGVCEGRELYDLIIARGRHSERVAAALIYAHRYRGGADVPQTWGHAPRHGAGEVFVCEQEWGSPLKVIDFGLSEFFKSEDKFIEIVGTPEYMAPEIWKENYGPEVDVWSAWVILYFMLSGRYPFLAETLQGFELEILHGTLDLETDPWLKVSGSAKSLLRHMLERDPKARYNAQQVLNHSWFEEHNA